MSDHKLDSNIPTEVDEDAPWECIDTDALTKTCPNCGERAEVPDCIHCGHIFGNEPEHKENPEAGRPREEPTTWDSEAMPLADQTKAPPKVGNVEAVLGYRFNPDMVPSTPAPTIPASITFAQEVAKFGLLTAGRVIGDGQIHRVKHKDDKKGRDSGWYAFHDVGANPWGVYGAWALGEQHTWSSFDRSELTSQQREEHDRYVEEARKAVALESKRAHDEAACRALQDLLAAAPASPDHPYLKAKGVGVYGPLRQRGDELLIPIHTVDGDVRSYQRIRPLKEGGFEKRMMYGGEKKRCMFEIPGSAERIYIDEGYATGATLHEATGSKVVVAFDANNLPLVAEQVRATHPTAQIIIAGDNDWAKAAGGGKNTGVEAGLAAANRIQALAVFPTFREGESGSDWNDLAALHGVPEVRRQLEQVLRGRMQEIVQPETPRKRSDSRYTTEEAEQLIAHLWHTRRRAPHSKDWKRVPLDDAGGYTAPWFSIAAQTLPEDFLAQVDSYLERRIAKVEKENLKRMARGEEPESDMPADAIRAHAVDWYARIQALQVPTDRGRELLARLPSPRIDFVPVGELLREPEPMRWLIRDYLIPASINLLFGPPASGKSLVALAWATCVAMGREWEENPSTMGPVVYLAGEGHFGISRRVKALAQHWCVEEALREAPLFVSRRGASLTDSASLDSVIDEIEVISASCGPPVLIVIDTLHRNFGPGDENSAADMGAFVAAADTLRDRFGSAVLIVHHSGHGEQQRARGSSALRAAVDTEYQIECDASGIRTLSATKRKDAPPIDPTSYQLEVVELPWRTQEGELETSVVLTPCGGNPAKALRKRPTAAQQTAYDALLWALSEHGTPPTSFWPQDAPSRPERVVSVEKWREAFYLRSSADKTDGKKKAFQRARNDLHQGGAVSLWDDHYWPLPGGGKWPEFGGMHIAHPLIANARKREQEDAARHRAIGEPTEANANNAATSQETDGVLENTSLFPEGKSLGTVEGNTWNVGQSGTLSGHVPRGTGTYGTPPL